MFVKSTIYSIKRPKEPHKAKSFKILARPKYRTVPVGGVFEDQ